jgi:hypothetical protein
MRSSLSGVKNVVTEAEYGGVEWINLVNPLAPELFF